jgi:hypothetical protein
MVKIKQLNDVDVIEQLNELKLKKDQTLVWISFPYSEKNLKIIESSIKKISQNAGEYRVTFDENIIFVERDSF